MAAADPSAYVELHVHSCWSLREGASSCDELIDRALELGYPALALTDHDNLYGAMEFARTAHERGLRPISGAEITLSEELEDHGQSHLTLLAADTEGYRNLCRLLSRAHRVHGKDTPRVDQSSLFEYHQGLIVLSGCREGLLSRLLDPLGDPDPQAARALAGAYRDVFGDRYYVELQHHAIHGDSGRTGELDALATRLGISTVATNNVHYHVRERHRLNDVLVAVRHRLTLDSSHRERRPNSEFFLKSGEEMARRFGHYPAAIAASSEIAERCVFNLCTDIPYRLPDRSVPDGHTLDSYLRQICERAFGRRYGADPQAIRNDARKRLDRELELIGRHGLAGFFLVYWDILQLVNEVAHELHGRSWNLAPDEKPVGRGRGSSVSSIVCYLIGLSHIDPVRNELYLERFLNDELISLPDIDLDFPRDIRDELLRRVYDRWGPEHAALVAAFPTYQMRSAVLDIGKALGLPGPALAKLNKLGDHFAGAENVEQEMARIPELRSLAGAPVWRDLVDLARQVAGFPRHISQHVGGIVISAEPLSSVVPVEPARMEGRFVCQWDKDSIDDARFVKIDFLALGMLSAVGECLNIIEEVHGRTVDLGRVPHDSREIFDSIQEGDTMGVFQIESRAQIQTLPKTRPKNIDDLAVQVAIIRPGPIVAGAFHPYMEYRDRVTRGEPVTVDYGHPELEPLLKHCMAETVGHVLYQDQVIQIACAVAGFTPGQADRLRRAMSRKRSAEAMDALAEEFHEGARRSGVSGEAAEVAWQKMAAFAAFGFPKSHAVAFALLAYESAWLRYHYPQAFLAALFNAQPMGFYSVEALVEDVRRHEIEVRMPDINRSRVGAWPEEDSIRLGLSQVSLLGGTWRARVGERTAAHQILAARAAGGDYCSLRDFVSRTGVSRDVTESLIRAGALDSFGLSRRELLWQLGLFVAPAVRRKKGRDGRQVALPLPVEQDMVGLPSLSAWEEMAWDYDRTGVSGKAHPMKLVRPLLNEGLITSRHLGGPRNPNRLPEGAKVSMAGMVITRQRPQTASGVMFLLLEDEFGLANLVVYRRLQEQQRELVRATPFVIVHGRVDNEQSGFPNIVVDRFERCPLPGRMEAPASHDFG